MLKLWIITAVLFFSLCYVIGGQWRKWVRRYLGSITLGVSIIAIDFIKKGFGISSVPLWIGAAWYCPSLIIFSYSVNDPNLVWRKVQQRGVYGFSLGMAGLFISATTGHMILGALQVLLAVAANIYFGVVNPFGSKWGDKSTMLTDFCIAIGSTVLLIFIV